MQGWLPGRVRIAALALPVAAVLLAGCSHSGTPSPAPNISASVEPAQPAVSDLPTASFSNISAADAKHLEVTVARLPGVQNVTYYKDTKTLEIYFRSGASVRKQRAAKRVVHRFLTAG